MNDEPVIFLAGSVSFKGIFLSFPVFLVTALWFCRAAYCHQITVILEVLTCKNGICYNLWHVFHQNIFESTLGKNFYDWEFHYSTFFDFFICFHVSKASWEICSRATPTDTVVRPQNMPRQSTGLTDVHSLKRMADAKITVEVNAT